MSAQKKWTGAPATNAKKVTPEMLAMMVDLLPEIGSLRDLCGITGLRLDVVRREVAPFLAIMKLTGTHPQCGCGRDRFHPYGCVDNYAKGTKSTVPGHRPGDHERILARRARVIAMMVAGDRFVDINAAMGFKHKDARKHLRFLTADQLEQRERAVERRGPIPPKSRKVVPREPFRPFRDELYTTIATVTPRWLSDSLREDVISDLYVAVSEGSIARADIASAAKGFATRAASHFENRFGPGSLDEALSADTKTTIGDMIEDPSALAAYNRLDSLAAGRAPWRKAA